MPAVLRGSLLLACTAVACTKPAEGDRADGSDRAVVEPVKPAAPASAPAWAWNLPKGLPTPPAVPGDNPMSASKVALGHALFMDKRLSVDGSRSCYSCHQNELGNADGRARALGPGNKDLPRNTPTIWNVAFHSALYWDGRSATLEQQAIAALKGANMAFGDAFEARAAELGALPEYAPRFREAFGLAEGDKVTGDHVAKALAAYERTLICGDTAVDRDQLDEAQRRGRELFMGKAGCVSCHAGPNYGDDLYHDVGLQAAARAAADADRGRGKISKSAADDFKFRTPSLRNVSKTAPYFHDGSVATLEEAVRFMARGGDAKVATRDPLLLDRGLTPAEITDLVAFLGGLACPGSLEVIGDQRVEGIGAPPP